MKKVALILAGCGFKDGSEIHESVLTILHVVKNGAEPLFFAPDIPQKNTINHLTMDTQGEKRNVLVESARIARGQIKNIKELNATSADALILPGGFGAAMNLCNFGEKGADCEVNPEVARVIRDFFKANKPIGAICIAPAVMAKVLGDQKVELTIGTDEATAGKLTRMGAKHVIKQVDEIHIDKAHQIVSTPAYMLARNIKETEEGIAKLVQAVVGMIKN